MRPGEIGHVGGARGLALGVELEPVTEAVGQGGAIGVGEVKGEIARHLMKNRDIAGEVKIGEERVQKASGRNEIVSSLRNYDLYHPLSKASCRDFLLKGRCRKWS